MKRTGWQIVTASVLGLSLTVTAAAQGPAGGLTSPLPFGELEKVFGQHEGFAATALVTLTATGQAKPMKLTLPMAYLNGKFRTETSFAQIMAAAGTDAQGAQVAQMMGIDKMITLADAKTRQAWMLVPALKGYTKVSVATTTSPDGKTAEAKVTKVKLSTETVDGRACIKYRMDLTPPPADQSVIYLWECAALKNFPIKLEVIDPNAHATVLFRNLSFTKPAADQFVIPTTYKAYSNLQELMMGGMQQMMMQGAGSQ
ncbi:MAG: hypothetical protein WCH61_06475 [bacterium]